MKKQLHAYLSCLICLFAFAMNGRAQTAFTITYTGLTGNTAAVGVPTGIINTTPYNGVTSACQTSGNGATTSYSTVITAAAGYNFTITSISGTAYASSSGSRDFTFRLVNQTSTYTSATTSIGSSSSCGGSAALTALTGSYTTTAGNAATITVLRAIGAGGSGGGYSWTKTLVISGTVTAVATKLALVTVPSTGTVNTNLASFTVEARKADNSLDNTYTSNITISKASGTGTVSGTLTKAAVNGVATFNDIQFSSAGTYTISAASSGLTGATSGNIVISVPASTVASDYFRSKQSGNWSSTSTWESSSNNSTWINATLAPNQNANTISILATHTVTVDADVSVSNTNIASNAALEVAPTFTVTVPLGKTIANSGTFTLKSSNAGTGNIGNSAGAVTGNVTVQRYIAGGLRGFRFLANPFAAALPLTQLTDDIDITGNGSDAATPPFTPTGSNAPSAFSYDPTINDAGTVTAIGAGASATSDPGWVPFTSAAGTVGVGDGLRLLIRGTKGQAGTLTGAGTSPLPVTLTTTGQLNPIGNFVKTVTYPTGGAGYNLIGNPYPSTIDLGAVTVGTGVNNNFWIFNVHQGTKGGYLTYAFENDHYSLPSLGGFIVKAIANSGNTVTFHEADKTATDTSTMLRTTNGNRNILEMSIVSGNIFWDRFLLQLDNKGTQEYDAKWDADKFANGEVSFYSLSKNNRALAIDVRPFQEDKAIPMGFVSNAARSYTLMVNTYELNNNMSLLLRDKYLGSETKVEQGMVYQFSTTSDAASQGESRFELIPKAVALLPVPASPNFSLQLSPNPASNFVKVSFSNMHPSNTTISIMDPAGKLVQKIDVGNVQSGQANIDIRSFAKGAYFVTVDNGKEKKALQLQVQ